MASTPHVLCQLGAGTANGERSKTWSALLLRCWTGRHSLPREVGRFTPRVSRRAAPGGRGGVDRLVVVVREDLLERARQTLAAARLLRRHEVVVVLVGRLPSVAQLVEVHLELLLLLRPALVALVVGLCARVV